MLIHGTHVMRARGICPQPMYAAIHDRYMVHVPTMASTDQLTSIQPEHSFQYVHNCMHVCMPHTTHCVNMRHLHATCHMRSSSAPTAMNCSMRCAAAHSPDYSPDYSPDSYHATPHRNCVSICPIVRAAPCGTPITCCLTCDQAQGHSES